MTFREAFAAELLDVVPTDFIKQAGLFAPRKDRLVSRLATAGALSSGALYGVSKLKGGLSADPYDGPQGTAGGALAKGAIGGLLAAIGLKALGRFHKH